MLDEKAEEPVGPIFSDELWKTYEYMGNNPVTKASPRAIARYNQLKDFSERDLMFWLTLSALIDKNVSTWFQEGKFRTSDAIGSTTGKKIYYAGMHTDDGRHGLVRLFTENQAV